MFAIIKCDELKRTTGTIKRNSGLKKLTSICWPCDRTQMNSGTLPMFILYHMDEMGYIFELCELIYTPFGR